MSSRANELPPSHLLVTQDDLEALAKGTVTPGLAKRAVETLDLLKDPITQAARMYVDIKRSREGELEVDDGALVSTGDDNGAYVHAWYWEDFAGTPLDKEADWRDELPENSQQWDLLSHDAAAQETVAALNQEVIRVVSSALAKAMMDGRPAKHTREAEQELTDFMDTLPHGGGDTEPRAIMCRIVEAAFDEFPSLSTGLKGLRKPSP